MHDISNRVLEKIREEHITPIPRWRFLARNYIFWTLFGLALVIGGAIFSIVLFMLQMNDWDVYWRLRKSIGAKVLTSVPYVWITLIVLFIALAYYDFINTRKAYRRRASFIMVGSVVASLFLGTAFYALGWGEKMDRKLEAVLPLYESGEEKEKEIWNQPEYGLISGEVVEEGPDGGMVVEDLNGDKWNVKGQLDEPVLDKKEDNNEDKSVFKKTDGGKDKDDKEKKKKKKVKIVGKKESDDSFVAEEVRSWDEDEDDDEGDVKGDTAKKAEEEDDDEDDGRDDREGDGREIRRTSEYRERDSDDSRDGDDEEEDEERRDD